MAGDGAAGVAGNIGDCIPRYTILSAARFLYEADVFLVMIYILIFLGKFLKLLKLENKIILDMQKCVRENIGTGNDYQVRLCALIRDSYKWVLLGTNFCAPLWRPYCTPYMPRLDIEGVQRLAYPPTSA